MNIKRIAKEFGIGLGVLALITLSVWAITTEVLSWIFMVILTLFLVWGTGLFITEIQEHLWPDLFTDITKWYNKVWNK